MRIRLLGFVRAYAFVASLDIDFWGFGLRESAKRDGMYQQLLALLVYLAVDTSRLSLLVAVVMFFCDLCSC